MAEQAPKRILLVEDEAPILRALTLMFNRHGFDVREAQNGRIGLEIALAEHPDLIVLDIIMPKMDGLAMLEELRKDTWGKTVPAIIFSNSSYHENIERAQRYQIREYLHKTRDSISDLIRIVKRELNC